ncbi:hypothetical protein DFH94DRAFT_679586 [Russula ochroleuca]|uniref:MARVEL domain-containing protein n=1 Tax=Russula ochroleuca TaxID=152965 RepID=A0A9P5TCK3_9AGAM|nr:hypothetical protein DFH94DRAFT_679586 [Russula ochroleuca]
MSSSSVKVLSLVRMVTFGTTMLFSFIVLALSADYVSLVPVSTYNHFAALALFTALTTLLTVTPMLVIDMFRQGSFLSYIVVEIAWLSILWVFWLSCGSDAASFDSLLISASPAESSCAGFSGVLAETCGEIKAIMAFSFLSWILLMAYTIVLLVLAIRAHQRGNSAWTTSMATGGAAQVYATPVTIPLSPSRPHYTFSHANPQIPSSATPYAVPQLPSTISYATPQV